MKRALLFIPILFITALFTQAQSWEVVMNSDLKFIENKKQWESNILFKADVPNGMAFFEKNKITYSFINEQDASKFHHPHITAKIGDTIRYHAFNQEFVGANKNTTVNGTKKQNAYHNYFIGSDSSKWASNVGLFDGVQYQNIYNNIHLAYTSIGKNLKYEFEVLPNADYHQIKIKYHDAGLLFLENGLLHIKTSANEIMEQAPYCYQIIEGKKKVVDSKFILKNDEVSFKIGTYNKSLPLIIDPTFIFCTYTGSTTDNWGTSATFDNAGNLYAAGITSSISNYSGAINYAATSGYPTTLGAFQTTYGGGNATWNPFEGDISISKFNTTGTALIYSTFLGGSNNDFPNSLIVNNNDELIVFGRSYSSNFPVTAGCFQNTNHGTADIIITKFSASGGGLIGSTYVGGNGLDGVNYSDNENILGSLKHNYGDDARGEVNLDANGNIYIASCTMSSDFPTTSSCFQNSFGGGLEDGVIFRMNPTLTQMRWGTYMGGTLNDACFSLDIDDTNHSAYVTGGTESTNFPTTLGAFHTAYQGGVSDGFLLHIDSNGTNLLASTYVGTNSYDQSYFVKLDKNNIPYIMGQTAGAYPVSASVYKNVNSGQFITRFNPALNNYQLSTVVGNGNGLPNCSPTAFSVDNCDNVFWAGWGGAFGGNFSPGAINNMPVTSNAFKSVDDGTTWSDFYIMVLSRNFASLNFGTYYGGTGSIEHVDGGTSRFDKNGNIYGAICAGCGGDSKLQASSGAYSTTNKSTNCNLAAFKMSVGSTIVNASANASLSFGCFNQPIVVSTTSTAQSYFWDFGDGTTSTLQNPSHQYTVIGNYTIKLIVTDSTTCNIVDSTFLPFTFSNDSVHAHFNITTPHLCPGDVAQFNSTSTVQAHTHYYWKFGDGGTSTLANPSHQFTTNGNFIVTLIVTDTFTCNLVDSIKVNVSVGTFLITDSLASSPTNGCPPFTVNFTGTVVNSTNYYIDFGDGSAIVTNSLNTSHTYNSIGNFVAKFVANKTLATCNDSAIAAVLIQVDTAFTKAIASTPVWHACTPITIQFSNGSYHAQNYIWNFGDGSAVSNAQSPIHTYSTTGNFTIKLICIDTTTCNRRDSVTLFVKTDTNKVHATALANPVTGCTPLNVSFKAFNNNAVSLLWKFNDVNNTTSTITNPSFIYTDTLLYHVLLIATDTTKCNRVDTSTIDIDPYFNFPIAKFKVSDTAACIKLNVNIYNESTGAMRYAWQFGDNTTSNLFNPPIHTFDSTFYNTNHSIFHVELIVFDSTKCITSDTAYQNIHIYKMPISAFNILPSALLKPDSIFNFINKSYNTSSFKWIVDQQIVANSVDFIASWYSIGYHTICLVASSDLGCEDTICKQVQVDVIPSIGVPNAFSPDGDGHNDYFKVYGFAIDQFDFRVFNRWGQLVFETTNRNEGWDGTFHGKLQEMDVYAWTVRVTFLTGEKRNLKGNVTLVR
jgi:gliding motility-associated-like protein